MNSPRGGRPRAGREARRPRTVGPVRTERPAPRPGEDSIDRHVERWRTWDALALDEDVEAVVTRISRIAHHLRTTTTAAADQVGLALHEYRTLHKLMIRDTPGHATIGELARSGNVSPATMTNRVDALESSGLVRRIPSEDDRRRIDVEATEEGYRRWLLATRLRGEIETALFTALPAADRRRLADLLRCLVLTVEQPGEAPDGVATSD